jgi:acyl-coenzyme A synthetase/AMP-(fatty) acid ligase
MYKTGDSARFLSNGMIEVSGRLDSQVKLRGYRIELGDIDHALLCHTQVKEAVTMLKDIAEYKALVGCIMQKKNNYVQKLIFSNI